MTKKKVTPKAVQPTPKYKGGQKVFFISYNNPERPVVLQGEIISVNTESSPERDVTGKITGAKTWITYAIHTAFGPHSQPEHKVYQDFPTIAKVFTEPYLVPLR